MNSTNSRRRQPYIRPSFSYGTSVAINSIRRYVWPRVAHTSDSLPAKAILIFAYATFARVSASQLIGRDSEDSRPLHITPNHQRFPYVSVLRKPCNWQRCDRALRLRSSRLRDEEKEAEYIFITKLRIDKEREMRSDSFGGDRAAHRTGAALS